MEFSKKHFDTEGPLGLPMKDTQASMLERLLKSIAQEDRQLKRIEIQKAPSEVLDGERADVSWITTESIDRENEVVIAKGMNESHFKLNPIVTLQHEYWAPPVGKSLWRKRIADGQMVGVKAKTQYTPRPSDWPAGEDWDPDCVFSLIKAGMMMGKSVGFLRIKSHCPTPDDIKKNPELANCYRIIDEWLLLEYACTFLPMNQEALVEAVSKSAIKGKMADRFKIETPATRIIPFTPFEEIEKAIKRSMSKIDIDAILTGATNDTIAKMTGRI